LTFSVVAAQTAPTLSGPETVNVEEGPRPTTTLATYTSSAGPSSLSIDDAANFVISTTTGALSFVGTDALDHETKSSYTVIVTATASEGETTTLTVTVNVTDREPTLSGPETLEFAEGATPTGTIATYTTDGTISTTLGGADAASFAITAGGALSFASGVTLDYEAKTSYSVTITANLTDAGGNANDADSTTLDLTVNITDVGPTLSGPETVDVPEGAAPRGTLATYTSNSPLSLKGGTGDVDNFDLSATTGALSFASTVTVLDHEAKDSHTVTVVATNDMGTPAPDDDETTELVFTVNVTDVEPTLSGPAMLEFPEGAAPTGAIATYTSDSPMAMSGTDSTSFVFDPATGALSFADGTVLDYEDNTDGYSVTITATLAGAGTEDTKEIEVTVSIMDVGPAITGPTALEFAENTPIASINPIATYTSDGLLASTPPSGLKFNATTGQLSFSADTTLDHEAAGGDEYVVTITATQGGELKTLTLTVTITDVGPAISGPAEVQVAEGERPTDPIATYTSDGTISGTLGGADASEFSIDVATGALSFAAGAALDRATKASYTVIVVATQHGEPKDLTVTVTVGDAPAAPVTGDGTAPAPAGTTTTTTTAPAAAPAMALFSASNSAVTVTERQDTPGQSSLVFTRHDGGASFSVQIGWISSDGMSIIALGFVRDEALGQTYAIVRRESDGQIVRLWVAPDSALVYAVNWPDVLANYTVPLAVLAVVPLDGMYPAPNQLARRFDGGDDRIFSYDANLGQWRHVPDLGTFQSLGFYWCDVTAADAGFFGSISTGPAHPSSGTAPSADYPSCRTS
jgi:hypothetical protein